MPCNRYASGMGVPPRRWHRARRPLFVSTAALYVVAVALLFFGLRWRGELVYDLSGAVSVEAGSPAAKAGIVTGDRVVSIGETAVPHFDAIRPALLAAGPGEVSVDVERGTERLSFNVHRARGTKLGVRPPVVENDLPVGSTLERCLFEPLAIWSRAWKKREIPLEMDPDAHGAVSFAEFLRPRGSADKVVSAGMVSSYAAPLPALLGLALLLTLRRARAATPSSLRA